MSADGQGVRILLVDDDRDLLRVFSAGLRRFGFDVTAVETADAALEHATGPDAETFHVLVIDMVLQDGWGANLALSLRPAQPEAEVIYISGYAKDDPILREGIEEHMRFLHKPLTVVDLVEAIREIREGSEAAPGDSGLEDPDTEQ